MADSEKGYFLRDREPPDATLDGFLAPITVSRLEDLSPRDWLEVARFVDETVLVPGGGEQYRSITPEDPNHMDYARLLWDSFNRTMLQIVLSARGRIIGTAGSTLTSSDFAVNRDRRVEIVGAPDHVSHFHLGVDPSFRNRGVFHEILRPALEHFERMVAQTRGEIKVIVNVAPGDDPARWAKYGFELAPGEYSEVTGLDLAHLVKVVRAADLPEDGE
jgi:GNAT superfamily N-acetyltransferase